MWHTYGLAIGTQVEVLWTRWMCANVPTAFNQERWGWARSLSAGGEETLTIHHQLQWLVVPIPDCDPTVLHSRNRKVYEFNLNEYVGIRTWLKSARVWKKQGFMGLFEVSNSTAWGSYSAQIPRGAESEERERTQTAFYCIAISKTALVSTSVLSTIPSDPFTPVKHPEPKSVEFI